MVVCLLNVCLFGRENMSVCITLFIGPLKLVLQYSVSKIHWEKSIIDTEGKIDATHVICVHSMLLQKSMHATGQFSYCTLGCKKSRSNTKLLRKIIPFYLWKKAHFFAIYLYGNIFKKTNG